MNFNKFKYILYLVSFLLSTDLYAQSKNVKLPENWQNLDLLKDGYFGISTEKAYQEILNSKTPKQKIIVAVMDSGVDVLHEDLKDVLWTNPKEIPGNGIDDDGNGYVDDVHGWNFLGSSKGNLQYDNLEFVRLLKDLKPKYQSTTNLTPLDSTQKIEYKLYQKLISDFGKKYEEASQNYSIYLTINKMLDDVAKFNNTAEPTLELVDAYKTDDEMEDQIKKIIRRASSESGGFDKFYKSIKDGLKELHAMLNYNLNMDYDERLNLVGDDYLNSNEKIYGNKDVAGPDAKHGTHVAGIIGANRENGTGIKGVANNVSIMAIRVVPDGDERDKDVANGIRYAVDNGVRVINMSFGKAYVSDKKVVDEAIKYAESKNVLLVHAAGNDNQNNDKEDNFPTKYFDSDEAEKFKAEKAASKAKLLLELQSSLRNNSANTRSNRNAPTTLSKLSETDNKKFSLPHASNWLEVGASAYSDDENLKASFSNYGKYNVDVFAPGFMINSTVPNSKYEEYDGTSMAAPVVSGLAALILSYYPHLTAPQVKEIIMKSVTKVNQKVKYKDDKGQNIRVPFADICVSGGIVNTYNALKLAETY